jgi:phosphoribosyl 1,2-cyclic phosphodiesterase
MLTLHILGSSSAGNCAVVSTSRGAVLIDAGFSCRQITRRLEEVGLAPEDLSGIVLTHEHGDHTRGLEVFCRKHKHLRIPIYTNPHTAHVLKESGKYEDVPFWLFRTGSEFTIQDMTVHTFSVPHDAVDPVGLIIENGSGSLGYLTDLGHATRAVIERIRRVHTLVIETNYDRELLMNDTKRPWPVKQRIHNRHGHLSNQAACDLLTAMMPMTALKRLVLSHLSSDCNTPELALKTIRDRLEQLQKHEDIEVICSMPQAVSEKMVIQVTPETQTVVEEQMELWSWGMSA